MDASARSAGRPPSASQESQELRRPPIRSDAPRDEGGAMPDSPMSASPYEVLGVPATASDDDLRRAYRRLLRETHPDTGGDPQRFIAVQVAWERIGSPDARRRYDAGHVVAEDGPAWAPPRADGPQHHRPTARAYG